MGVTLALLSGYGEPPDPVEKFGRGGSMNIAVGDISEAGQTAALASFAARLRFGAPRQRGDKQRQACGQQRHVLEQELLQQCLDDREASRADDGDPRRAENK